MSYHRKITNALDLRLRKVREFLRMHRTALAKVAHALGGQAASARVLLLSEAVRHTTHLTRAQGRQLVDLHRLLTLNDVGDPDRIETGCFAMIDPDFPIVEECCLLAKKLEALLRLIADDDAVDAVDQMMAITVKKVA